MKFAPEDRPLLDLYSIVLLFVSICLPAGISLGLYWRESGLVEQRVHDREMMRVNMLEQIFRSDLESVANTLRLLADGDGIRAYLKDPSAEALDRIRYRAAFVGRQEKSYDQVRYLDERGREVVRVNKGGELVPQEKLQDKSGRNYFEKAKTLPAGHIFVSAFDLNVENGRIEQPLKPMLRFSTPVYDTAGQRRGVYVINYLGADLLGHLLNSGPTVRDRLRLLNAKGDWIKASDPAQEWGAQLPGRASFSLNQTDPNLWARIVSEPEGQVRRAGGLFSWKRITPDSLTGGNTESIKTEEPFLVIASEVSSEEWNTLFEGLRHSFIVTATALTVLALSSIWFYRTRQRVLSALRRSEENLAVTLESIGDGVIATDTAGNVARMNGMAESLTGWQASEAKGRPIAEVFRIIHGVTREPAVIPVDRVLATGEIHGLANHTVLIARNGTELSVDDSAAPIRDRKGALRGVVLVFHDVSHRRQSEARIQHLNTELQVRAEQLEIANKELESFSYSISHDLRAPLRHIQGYVEMLAEEIRGQITEKGSRYLKTISTAGKEMGELIDGLLAFSRMSRSEMRSLVVDPNRLIGQCRETLEPEVKDRVIRWKLAPLPNIQGDPTMIKQVFLNLLANAVKYTRNRQETEIEIGICGEETERTIFYVRDNGAGFDMRYAQKLFGVFQRLHRTDEFEGTGIGLANVHRIIVRHGGRIWAESQVNAGATFFFTLALASFTEPEFEI